LRQRSLLMPGDQVRTSVRGANALEARFTGGAKLIVGPGSLVELTGPSAVRLYRGELSVELPEGKKREGVQVTGPGGFQQLVKSNFIGRVSDGKTVVLAKAPRWLTGYKNSTTDEWVGSLIAKVDGREVPMSVGYHKVDAVIRDQIAQTTVEQSFINSTKNRLEGVFYFPLPADASISGFGMWIGGELVEADIVEKQRARQIYEDILRRKKDPGLLEWSGGNLFKARVFPIEPHSEKRIRIRYTQVLPMEGSTVRYRYALRSELLRKRPLRSLGIKISVSSAMNIEDAASSTHEVRVRKTAHAATLEFDAQEYTPEKDFEAAITLNRAASLTVVPHRRSADGYFMMLLSPPGAASGKWKRDLMPEGKPVDLIVIADTSASMDTAARGSQADFIRGLLTMLGKKDRFRLVTADLGVANFAADPVAVSDKSIESAMAFLAARDSMGWTDLDRVLAQIEREAKAGTVFVYVGDGIGTTGDADPVALAKRVRQLGADCKGVVHAVSTASTFEQGVLEALASIGGGSVRSTGDDPAQTAYALLAEAAQPAVKDLKVEFEGLRTARVYPETPPNLPVGQQQVLLGRFLSTGQDQRGRAIVTGTLDGKAVRYVAPIEIKAGEAGNSFIPRLWARRHLDHLLSAGRSAKVQEDIVGFSQEFGIMTPYTSFLVLENDEDRKRYGVERRVRMRDGQKFFAKGRDDASTEILRQQMRQARTYRLQMRLRMLSEIEGLGRSLQGWAVSWSEGRGTVRDELQRAARFGRRGRNSLGPMSPGAPADGAGFRSRSNGRLGGGEDLSAEYAGVDSYAKADRKMADKELYEPHVMDLPADATPALEGLSGFYKGAVGGGRRALHKSVNANSAYGYFRQRFQSQVRLPTRPPSYDFGYFGFPYLPAPHREPKDPRRADWPKEVLDLLASLDRRARVEKSDVGFILKSDTDHVHPLQGRITGWSSSYGFYVGGSWVRRDTGRNAQPITSWVYDGKRAVVVEGLNLGRRRAADANDRKFAFSLLDYSTRDFSRSYVDYEAKLVAMGGGQIKVILSARKPRDYRMEFVIDRGRRVVTQLVMVSDGKVTSTTNMADFIEKGGQFWARKVECKNAKGRVIWRRRLSVETTTASEVAGLVKVSTTGAQNAIFVGHKDPKIADSKQAIHVGKSELADHFRIVTHYAATQQWDKTWAAWKTVETKIGENRGVPLMRLKLQSASRQGEEFKAQLRAIIVGWPGVEGRRGTTPPGIDFLTNHVRQLAGSVLSRQERLTLLESLEPICRRRGKEKTSARGVADAQRRDISYRANLASFLNSMGRVDEALRLREQNAARHADHFDVVMSFVNALGSVSDHKRRSAVIAAHLAKKGKWLEAETSQFFDTWLDVLFYLRDLPGMNRVASDWMKADPENWVSYHCYLGSLMFRDRATEVERWIGARLGEEPSDAVKLAKIRAAVHHAIGQGWSMGTNTVDDAWQIPLASLVRRCAKTGGTKTLQIANEIVGNYYFRRTDAFRDLRKEFLVDMLGDKGIAEMPLNRMAIYMSWIVWGRNSIDRKDWEKARDMLRARFDKAGDVGAQGVLGSYVLQVLDAWQEKKPALQFLRDWMAVAKSHPETVANNLFNRLLSMKWTKEYENEAFALVGRLQPKNAASPARELIASAAIRRLADNLLSTRIKAALGPVAELEKLPRQERRDREKRTKLAMRKELAARFGLAADDVGDDPHENPWFRIEQLCFDAEAGADRTASVAAAAKALAAVAGKSEDDEPLLRRVLRERCALVMAYASTRRGVAKSVGDAALAYYSTELTKNEKTLDWRYQIFRLMIALDRTDALAAHLREWIVPEKAETTWRRSLGYLLAERGKLKDAVEVFEGVESADELSSSDYAALASWHLVLGDDKRRDRALARKLDVSSESQLAQILYSAQSKASRRGGGLSGALAPEDFRGMSALMKKANRPENYMWQVQNTYRTSKDFRVLACLPYGVVGHTSGSIYRFLGRVGNVVKQVHEEATCDSLSESIAKVTAGAKRTIDRRGLLLITARVEQRAAEVKNAPGDHIASAYAAMRDSFKGEWERGERALMAAYLASLGRINHSSLANEQLRQLRELFAGSDNATGARLSVARSYAKVLWTYKNRDDAIDVLTMALDDSRKLFKGVLPRSANSTVSTLANYYRTRQHFSIGEKFLLAERDRQGSQIQKNWYSQQLYGLYINCVQKHGEVSLGRGEKLYLALREILSRRMWEGATDVMDPAFSYFLKAHSTAAKAGIRRAKKDLLTFVKKTLPELATRFVLEQGNRINRVANTVRTVVNASAAVDTLVTALEREPKWLRSVNREYWRYSTWNLSRYRREAHDRKLDARLLPIALRELRIDLGRMNWRNTSMFWKNKSHFWGSAAGDFARVTREFIKKNDTSVAKVMYGANYLWNGLAQRESAIAALEGLHDGGRLHESGRWQLARWYDDTREYDSAIPLLKALVEKRVDRLDYRIRLISVHYKSADADAAKTLMLATAKKWTEKKWWNEGSMSSLAKVAFESRFWKEAAKWYEEAVRENERSGSRRSNWRNTRSGYYGFMARAHVRFGNTDAAVDAASAAVVTWGNDQRNRKIALKSLHRVLARVPDLDGYVKRWDAKVADTGLDAPLIRKYLGIVYLEQGTATKALAQLLLARELQPTDDDVHKRILSAYDRLGDKTGAIQALKRSITMSPMNLDLYGILAHRLNEADDKIGSERAYTSMVEVKPNEAESHRRLAKVRDNQKRFKDAVVQWRQVIRVRTLEPDGWLGLARSQIHAGELDGAKKSIKHVLDTKWEARFKTAKTKARGLERLLQSKGG